MSKHTRLHTLEKLVFQHKVLYVPDIVRLMKISAPTARRYIRDLAAKDCGLEYITNGIRAIAYLESELLFNKKLNVNREKKIRIAQKALELISNRYSLLIDSGSTCFFFAQELNQNDLHIATTDLQIGIELGKKQNIAALHSIGGEVRPGFFSIGGPAAVNHLRSFNVETAVMSADAIDMQSGITNIEMFEVSVKQAVREQASELILLADSSKFGKRAVYSVLPLSKIDTVVTDTDISDQHLKMLQEMNIRTYTV